VGSALEFAESSDGRALYVLSGGNQQESVWVIDLTTRQVMKTIDGIAFPFSIIAVPEVQMRQQPDSKRKPFALQPAVPHEPTPLSETDSKQSAPIAELLLKNLPQPTDYVSDFAHVLSPDVVRRLDRICSQLDHTQANAQVAVVTIPTIDGAEVADYAKELGNKWGIGRKGSDRGVLVLLAVNDHKWRINVGYGLESILPDPKTGEIGREMVPLLRANDFDGAIALAVSQVAQVIAANANVTLDDAVAPLQR
jgi:hypothetical protein